MICNDRGAQRAHRRMGADFVIDPQVLRNTGNLFLGQRAFGRVSLPPEPGTVAEQEYPGVSGDGIRNTTPVGQLAKFSLGDVHAHAAAKLLVSGL